MDVDILVVAYYAKKDLDETVRSIQASSAPGYRLTVYDNAEKNYPLSWIWNRFAEASTRAYLAFLNPDILLSSGWDSEAEAVMDTHPRVASAGPLSNTEPHREAFGPAATLPAEQRALDNLAAGLKADPKRFLVTGDHRMVAGHCLTVRRTAWTKIGGFNEGVPFAGNDYDFNSRLVREGMELAVCLHAACYHKWNRSIDEGIRRGTFDTSAWCPKFSQPPKGSIFPKK